jgi:hypothetical protein
MLLRVKKIPIDLNKYKRKSATENDCSRFIDYDAEIEIDGRLAIVYRHRLQEDGLEEVRNSLTMVKYNVAHRTGGMTSTSRIFGYSPRNHVKSQPCRATSLAIENQIAHSNLCKTALIVEKIYSEINPQLYKKHKNETDQNLQDSWKMEGTCFTSGIANDCNPLQYHFDSGNYAGVWSGMIVFKKHISGGHLSIPELDLTIACGDKSLLLFDGQSLLHGVTPIRKVRPDGRRFSLVYYSLKQMWRCLDIDGEIDRLREVRTKTERKDRKD